MNKKKLLKYSIVLGIIKKVALLLFFIFSSKTFAQISEVDTSNENETIGEIALYSATQMNGSATLKKMRVIDGKQYYYLGWQNQKYKTITDIVSLSFHATPKELDALFEMLAEVIKTGNEKTINLGSQRVVLSRIGKNMIFFFTSDGYFDCNAAALHKLFGKQWDKKAWKAYLKS